MNWTNHLQAVIAISLVNGIIQLGPDVQFQKFTADHLWAHLLYIIIANVAAGVYPYLKQQNPTLPAGPAQPK